MFKGASLALVTSMEKAFSTLDDRVVTIQAPEGVTTVELLGKRVRENQPGFVWAFDGKNFYLSDPQLKLFVSGKCLRHRAVEVVSRVTHQRVDVLTRALLFRRTPFEEALIDCTVSVMGYAAPHGVPCDILQAERPSTRTTIFLRRSDHLPQSLSSASYVDGKLVSTMEKSFSYAKLTHPRFVLQPTGSEKVGKFPVLKKEKI